MFLVYRMGVPAFFLPYSRSDFGKVGIHLRGFCIHLGQAEGTCKGECLAINACTADDVDVFVGLATVQCFFQDLFGSNIQMVGGLVQDQEVGFKSF